MAAEDDPKKTGAKAGAGAGAGKTRAKPAAPAKSGATGTTAKAKAASSTGAKTTAVKKAAPAKSAATSKAAAPKSAASKASAPKPAAKGAAAKRTPAATPKPTAARTPPPKAEAPKTANNADTPKAETPKADAAGEAATTGGTLSERWASAANRVFDTAAKAAERYAEEGPKRSTLDPFGAASLFADMAFAAMRDPKGVMDAQMRFAEEMGEVWMRSWSRMMSGETPAPVIEPEAGDKRFRDPRWSDNAALDLIKQSYLTARKNFLATVDGIEGLEPTKRTKASFLARQLADAASPTNFAFTNPEVIDETIRTKGENLLKGFENLAEDIARGGGAPAIRQTDMEAFKVGENVATAPGQVVFRNDILELIQYSPSTETVDKRPLLIFPPWINKFYILDLRPENSFVRWAVDQGLTVFLVSWVNPGRALKHKTFEDYMMEGIYGALDAVEKACAEREVDAIGYCIGGTLLSCALAHMAAKGDDRIQSATFFAAQADFEKAGELKVFIDEEQLDNLAERMDANGGVLDSAAMATAFNMLRANDLIWSFVVNNYLMGRDPKRFDLLFWNADATNLTKEEHLFYLRRFYHENALAKGEMTLGGVKLDLKKVTIPVFMQASLTDHIAPYPSVYRGLKLFGGPRRFMLAGSGHIAGVINPPAANKYQHWTRDEIDDDVEDWLANAEEKPGSWWPAWRAWLKDLRSGDAPARDPEKGGLKPLAPAPGTYVKAMNV